VALASLSACFSEAADAVSTTATSSETSNETETTAPSTSSSTTPLPTSDSSADTTSTTAESSESGTGAPVCGDELVEGDEECDDGNMAPADGCTDCRTSLSIAWINTYGAVGPGIEAATAVASGPASLIVGGTLIGPRGTNDYWVESVDPMNGEPVARLLEDGPSGGFDYVADVALQPDDRVWVTGVLDHPPPAGGQIETRRLTTELSMVWAQQAGTDLGGDVPAGLALTTGGAIVGATLGGMVGTDAWIQSYAADGALGLEYLCDCGGLGAIAEISGGVGGVRAIGLSGLSYQLWGFDDAIDVGPLWTAELPTSGSTFGIAVDAAGATFVCGTIAGGSDADLWIAELTPDGASMWSASHDLGDGDHSCRGIQLTAEGLIAVGEIRDTDTSAYSYVARLDVATGTVLDAVDLIVEDSTDTRALAITMSAGVPYVVGAYAVDGLDDDAFVARLIP
jgi:cysteine-rich repeat protein